MEDFSKLREIFMNRNQSNSTYSRMEQVIKSIQRKSALITEINVFQKLIVFSILSIIWNDFAEKTKILLDTDQKIIFLNYQNNFVGILKVMSNVVKNFNILATVWMFYIIILIVQQNYFSDLYSSKILDFSAKKILLI